MGDAVRLTITAEAAPLLAVLAEIEGLLAELPEGSAERGEALVRLRELFDEGPLVNLDCSAAPDAGDLLVRFQPSDRLRSLVAALGAGNV